MHLQDFKNIQGTLFSNKMVLFLIKLLKCFNIHTESSQTVR